MHYQAAERALLLLNSDTVQKMVKANMNKAFPIVVQGLLNGSQRQHWNQTVTTITYSVIRSYMEMDKEKFERFTSQAQTDQKLKEKRQKDIEEKWNQLNIRYNIEPSPPIFPLILWKPEKGQELDRY